VPVNLQVDKEFSFVMNTLIEKGEVKGSSSGRLALLALAIVAVLMVIPIASWAAPAFSGTLTITPDDPIDPIPVGPPGIDLTANWTANKDLTRFEWLVDSSSQGINNVASGEAQIGNETQNFTFVTAGDYEVCFHVYHHEQTDRDLTDCVTIHVVDASCTWYGESAMSDGYDYSGANWFTYTAYLGAAQDSTLCAGSTCLDAGTVSFSDPDTPSTDQVTITITLNSFWRFKDIDENVKIQDYASAPTANPTPGLFTYKSKATGSPYSAPAVPENYYYGVHVDVERCVLE